MFGSPSRRDFIRSVSAAAGASFVAQLADARDLFAGEVEALKGRYEGAQGFPGIQGQYMLAADVTYLNHASIGTVPRPVHAAGLRYRAICEENPWLYIWGGAWEEAREILYEYLDGELEGVSHERVKAHFDICARCYPRLSLEKSFLAAVEKAGIGEKAPPELRTKVLDLLENLEKT